MCVEVVAGQGKMLIEGASVVSIHIMTMCVEAQMRRGFTFPYILVLSTEDAVAEIDYIAALTVQAMEDFQFLPGNIAFESFGRDDNLAAFILCGA